MSVIRRAARRVSERLGHRSAPVRLLRPAYDRFLAWSAGPRGLLQPVNDEAFRIDPRMRRHVPEVYEPESWRYLKAHARPGHVSLNMGAHVGIYALALAKWTAPDGRVFAFEPNPAIRAVLQTHVAMNDSADRVEVIAEAIGDRVGRATFFAAGTEGFSRLNAQNPRAAVGAPLTVATTTIDRFCEARQLTPDWIVMDVEGLELSALEGARETIRGGRGRLGLLVEMHPDLWAVSGGSRERMAELLASLELRAVPLQGSADALADQRVVRLEYI